MRDIVVFGAGGFGAEAIWALEEMNKQSSEAELWNILGYVDDDPSKKGCVFYDYKTLGTPEEVAVSNKAKELWYFCAVGNNKTRASIVERMEKLNWCAALLIHPTAIFARNVKIGEGTYIGAGTIVCPNAVIGKHVLVNVRAVVGHDVVVDDYSQLCPGAQINGECRIGRGSLVGSNASIFPGKKVGEDAIVGGNSQVIRSVKAGTTVNGVPAVIISVG